MRKLMDWWAKVNPCDQGPEWIYKILCFIVPEKTKECWCCAFILGVVYTLLATVILNIIF